MKIPTESKLSGTAGIVFLICAGWLAAIGYSVQHTEPWFHTLTANVACSLSIALALAGVVAIGNAIYGYVRADRQPPEEDE